MVSTFTTNKAMEEPARGDYVGTWDSPVNSNWTIIDNALGTIQVIDLSGGSVVLSTAQARCPFLTFKGNLTGNVSVTIPNLSSSPGTIVSGGAYTIRNDCTNFTNFTVTLKTTAVQEAIGVPPGNAVDIYVEGTGSSQAGSIKFRNLGRVGSIINFPQTTAPLWLGACTVAPYLYCNGGGFSSATYPALYEMMGRNILPDLRGGLQYYYADGTGRLYGLIDGQTLFAAGGSPVTTINTSNIPNYSLPVTDPGHVHTYRHTYESNVNTTYGAPAANSGAYTDNTSNATTGITVNSGGSGYPLPCLAFGQVIGVPYILAR